MSYDRTTYPELKTRIEADIAAVPAVLREPLAAAWARCCSGIHGHLDWLELQNSPIACDLDRLSDWAELYAVPRLFKTASTGSATATGSVGSVVLADTLLRGTNDLNYRVVQAATIVAGVATVQLRCETTGINGNLLPDQVLTVVDPLSGIANSLTVNAGGLTGGADDELIDAWRLRVVDEWQAVTLDGARGGKPADYKFWAKSAHPSVTDALVYKHLLGIGTVTVRPICNTLTNRLPTAAVLTTVDAYLQTIAPMTAQVSTTPPTVKTVNTSLHLVSAVDTAANRAAIQAALSNAILNEVTEGATLLLAEIDAAVGSVTTQYVRSAPMADVVCGVGEVLTFGGVTWL